MAQVLVPSEIWLGLMLVPLELRWEQRWGQRWGWRWGLLLAQLLVPSEIWSGLRWGQPLGALSELRWG